MNNMLRSLSFLALMGLTCLAQERFTHSESGLSFALPGGWTYYQEGDHFAASSADETISLLIFVAATQEAAEGLSAIGDELDKIMTDSQLTTEVTEENVNGLTQVYAEGDGLVDGERIDWDFTMVVGGRKSMILIALGDLENNHGTLTGIYSSIQK